MDTDQRLVHSEMILGQLLLVLDLLREELDLAHTSENKEQIKRVLKLLLNTCGAIDCVSQRGCLQTTN